MKSTYFLNTIRGCFRLILVVVWLSIVVAVGVVGWAVLPFTTAAIVTVAAIGIACLLAANNTKDMMP